MLQLYTHTCNLTSCLTGLTSFYTHTPPPHLCPTLVLPLPPCHWFFLPYPRYYHYHHHHHHSSSFKQLAAVWTDLLQLVPIPIPPFLENIFLCLHLPHTRLHFDCLVGQDWTGLCTHGNTPALPFARFGWFAFPSLPTFGWVGLPYYHPPLQFAPAAGFVAPCPLPHHTPTHPPHIAPTSPALLFFTPRFSQFLAPPPWDPTHARTLPSPLCCPPFSRTVPYQLPGWDPHLPTHTLPPTTPPFSFHSRTVLSFCFYLLRHLWCVCFPRTGQKTRPHLCHSITTTTTTFCLPPPFIALLHCTLPPVQATFFLVDLFVRTCHHFLPDGWVLPRPALPFTPTWRFVYVFRFSLRFCVACPHYPHPSPFPFPTVFVFADGQLFCVSGWLVRTTPLPPHYPFLFCHWHFCLGSFPATLLYHYHDAVCCLLVFGDMVYRILYIPHRTIFHARTLCVLLVPAVPHTYLPFLFSTCCAHATFRMPYFYYAPAYYAHFYQIPFPFPAASYLFFSTMIITCCTQFPPPYPSLPLKLSTCFLLGP